jgi:CubicO group peptidase (beta-lactamase class C family)
MPFEAMLLNKGSLNGRRVRMPVTVGLRATDHLGSNLDTFFLPSRGESLGLGVAVVQDAAKGGGRSVGAFGWVEAYGTESKVRPELDVVAAVFLPMGSGSTRREPEDRFPAGTPQGD